MYVRSATCMYKEGLMMKAINNIGLSKLCCPGWLEFIRAIQEEPGVSDCVPAQHGKAVPLFPCVAELGFPISGFITGSHPPGSLLRTFKE